MSSRRHSFAAPWTPPRVFTSRDTHTVSPSFERARMAFHASPSPFGALSAGSGNPQTQIGQDLEEVQTEVGLATISPVWIELIC